jgi:hypothetical protein
MTHRIIKMAHLPEDLQAEIQRLWDLYRQDTGHMTFDQWIVATQTEPGKKAMALAVESALAPIDLSLGYSPER